MIKYKSSIHLSESNAHFDAVVVVLLLQNGQSIYFYYFIRRLSILCCNLQAPTNFTEYYSTNLIVIAYLFLSVSQKISFLSNRTEFTFKFQMNWVTFLIEFLRINGTKVIWTKIWKIKANWNKIDKSLHWKFTVISVNS